MFAVLGDVPFEMVGSPEELSDSRSYDYAEHRVINARPRLQWLADDLMTIRMEMLLHRSFTEPAAGLLALRRAAAAHAALPLIFGNGDFRGYFVITGIETRSRQLSSVGDILAITIRLNLRESPVDFDPTVPPVPIFIPIGIASSPIDSGDLVSSGVSALAAVVAPSSATSANLLPDDVPTWVIVRSAV